MILKEIYKHVQTGWGVLISIGIGIILSLYSGLISSSWVGFLAAGILLIFMILFSSLTIIVDDDSIKIKFGVGLIRKSFKLKDIKSCAVVRNKWWYGWGIHWTPKGILFNISGLDAVQLIMKSGGMYRIGTVEPQKLDMLIKSKLTK
ncbi:hypothetical protein KAS42_04765 [bacterium]|nr:hypothetical protein [bacterium]